VATRRALEGDVYQKAMGKEGSFEDYLKQDKDFNNAMEERRNKVGDPNAQYGNGGNGVNKH